MKVALRDHRGKFGGTWDGNHLVFDRDHVGEGETFELIVLDAQDAPAATPTPAPAPPVSWPEASESAAYVAAVKRELEAQGVNVYGADGAFNVTKRVAWGLRNTLGLLRKDGGENVVSWHGRSFSAGRVAYPDGRLIKIMTDVGGANGPTWADNGFVDPNLYVPAMDPDQ